MLVSGTREAMFGLNVSADTYRHMNQDIYLYFVGFQKVFDIFTPKELIEILKRKNIDSRDIKINPHLYSAQTVKVRIENQNTQEVKISRGVRQGHVLSPLLIFI